MPRQSIVARVERLEERVPILGELPGRIDALSTQISQVREEMHRGFSSSRDELRAEIRGGDAETVRTLREEIHTSNKETVRTLREEIHASNEETVRTLREEIRASGEEIMTRVRILHEDVISRLALIQEGQQRRPCQR